MNGFISLHRKLTEWEWYTDPNTKSVFIHLLLMASWKDTKWKGIVIKRGELITGRKSLSESLGISQRAIRTSLNHLKTTNEVTIKTTNRYSVISINNYDSYQRNDQPAVQQTTSYRPHLNTNNKENKIIREEKFVFDERNANALQTQSDGNAIKEKKSESEYIFDEYGNRSEKRKAGAGTGMRSLKELLQEKIGPIGNQIPIAT